MTQTPLVTITETINAIQSFANLSMAEQNQLIASSTAAVNRECDRYLGADTYRQTYSPERTRLITLKQYPVSDASRVTTDLNPVISVQNTSVAVQRASVKFTATGPADDPVFTGLSLMSQASGVQSVTPLLFASYLTVGSLAAAINALGSGWTASVLNPSAVPAASGQVDYNLIATADLNTEIGSQDAFSTACNLYSYTRDLQFKLLPNGEQTRIIQLFEGRPSGYRYPDKGFGYSSIYGYGIGVTGYDSDFGTVLVSYVAGWQTADVPQDIKQATIEAVSYYRDRQVVSGAYKSKSIGKVSWSTNDPITTSLPPYICAMLQPHRRCDFA